MKRLITLAITLLTLISCEKDQQTTSPTYKELEMPEIPVAKYPNVDATVQATYRATLENRGLLGEITVFQGYANASFRNEFGAFELCEEVSVEGQILNLANSIYEYDPGEANGIDYGSTVSWNITGTGRIPDISHTYQQSVPEIGNITVKDSLNLRNNLRLSIDNDSPFTQLERVDSLVIILKGQQGDIEIGQSFKEPTIYASADELAVLGTGPAFIQVSAFSVSTVTFENDYKVAFVNKGVFTRKVILY